MNTRFEYLYRDAGNWKKWGCVVFAGAPSAALDDRFRAACFMREFFIAAQVRLPELFFDEYPVNDDDHCFHEFSSLGETTDDPNDEHRRTIDEFVCEFEEAGKRWQVFAR
ncbi:MAG: hypothetical protein ACYC7A_17820 [Thermoanaerobaculia bacterium]